MSNTCKHANTDSVTLLQRKLKSTIALLRSQESPILVRHILEDIATLVAVTGERHLRTQHEAILGIFRSPESPPAVTSSNNSLESLDLMKEVMTLNRILREKETVINRLQHCESERAFPWDMARPGSCKSRKHRHVDDIVQ